eukprot:TRINITY_DN118_c1_g3_i1.p1 TRINITY_DN118_c1_g3~~TRINITY_DN118_c1_g3_i1.p1  ORF type:complete len:268 (+),score=72.32 TRINITY_DN118_c1_g3_i1:190-993(+)
MQRTDAAVPTSLRRNLCLGDVDAAITSIFSVSECNDGEEYSEDGRDVDVGMEEEKDEGDDVVLQFCYMRTRSRDDASSSTSSRTKTVSSEKHNHTSAEVTSVATSPPPPSAAAAAAATTTTTTTTTTTSSTSSTCDRPPLHAARPWIEPRHLFEPRFLFPPGFDLIPDTSDETCIDNDVGDRSDSMGGRDDVDVAGIESESEDDEKMLRMIDMFRKLSSSSSSSSSDRQSIVSGKCLDLGSQRILMRKCDRYKTINVVLFNKKAYGV